MLPASARAGCNEPGAGEPHGLCLPCSFPAGRGTDAPSLRGQGGRSHAATHNLMENPLQSAQAPAAPSPGTGDAVIPHPKAGEVLRQRFPDQALWSPGKSSRIQDSGAEEQRGEKKCLLRFPTLQGRRRGWGRSSRRGAPGHCVLCPSRPLVPRSHFFLLFSTLPNICFVNNNRPTVIFICRGDYFRSPN